MSFTFTQVKEHLTGMGHGGTLKKVRNVEAMFERSAARFLLKVHPLESVRYAALTSLVYDDFYNYSLPTDFGSLIDLIPDQDRNSWDSAFRNPAGQFDLQKAIRNRTISIEGVDGSKIIRINWRTRRGKVLNTMDSLTANGAWSVIGTASNLAISTIYKVAGSGSIQFDVATTGDGIQNSSMAAVDLTPESGISDILIPVYLSTDFANLTSITAIWGNDLTTNYKTGVAQTVQADGTAFKFGWNTIKVPWVSAANAGTVNPATIDSCKLTFAVTNAMSNVRVDNIMYSIGKNFDVKYYSKYLFKDATATTWTSRPVDNSVVIVDNDTLPIFLLELLTDMAQQMEGTDSAFDIGFAEKQLAVLYPAYKGLYPSLVKKQLSQTGSVPRLRRNFRHF